MSLEVVDFEHYVATNKGYGAMQGVLQQIASGKLSKSECVKAAKLALELTKRFDREAQG